ncbi:hypothetical protein F2P56_008554 [Juglans regia]|uniref:Reverse transcriptase domain-containing protein n=1 Tax=Juglans regia TaxID=51240 RepID=A0A833XVA5_JUGRE|nr:hypothetical protein F2P56_008554 [Juglans regia]
MSQIWRLEGWVTFKEHGEQCFLIEFQKIEDKERVLSGRPWFFDRHLLTMMEVDDKGGNNQQRGQQGGEGILVQEVLLHKVPEVYPEKVAKEKEKVTAENKEGGFRAGPYQPSTEGTEGVGTSNDPCLGNMFRKQEEGDRCLEPSVLQENHGPQVGMDAAANLIPGNYIPHGPTRELGCEMGTQEITKGNVVAPTVEEECKQVVSEAWQKICTTDCKAKLLRTKLKLCQKDILIWRQTLKPQEEMVITKGKQSIGYLQNTGTDEHLATMKHIQEEVVSSITANDIKWKQREKQHWLKHGDRNTQYFHMQANQRRKINAVKSIKDSQGRCVTKQSEIGEVFIGFFSSLFTTSHPSSVEQCLHAMDTKLDMDMKAWLLNPFTREEINAAVFHMNPLGSPGPDGFPAQFYQKHWEVVGEQVCSYALNFLNHGGSLNDVNDTYISLIPKVQSPKKVADYRPISLCNVLYKIVSKTIANRLKKILPQIIAPNQSAFVAGRLISDNTMVAYEILHSMNSRMQGKKGFMAVKLDMSKAYDRVEWKFIEAIMVKMDFPCFLPSRGLRQRDPLSPYLFILCAEALTSLLNQAEACGNLTPVSIGRGPINMNHFFFADDSLLFYQAKHEEIKCVLNIFELYEKGSGQVLNKDKFAIFFSKNTAQITQQQILQLAGAQSTSSFERYPGLPALVGRKKIASFHSLIDKTWTRVTNCRTKFLSVAGNEILLKAVLQAIPTYAMGMFLLPTFITRKLNQILRKFWWGFNEDSSKIQWGWRILQNPTSLVAQILKQKYFNKGDLLEAKLGTRPSFAWRGIHAGLTLLKKGLIWRVGNGQKINIWQDRWIPSLPAQKILTPREADCWCDKVSDIIDPHLKQWQESLILELFTHKEIEGIKAIPISLGGREDKLIWQFSQNNIYTVKSEYHLSKEMEREQEGESSGRKRDYQVWRTIWKLKVPPATKVFLWRACSEVLPTLANLKRRKVVEDNICLICNQELENSCHALWGMYWC